MSSTPPRPVGPQPPQLEVPADLNVEYVNLVRIAHSASELVFDFAHALPGIMPARVQSRVVMSPLAAKLFSRALMENLARFESSYGEIHIPGGISLADALFKPPPAPDEPDQK